MVIVSINTTRLVDVPSVFPRTCSLFTYSNHRAGALPYINVAINPHAGDVAAAFSTRGIGADHDSVILAHLALHATFPSLYELSSPVSMPQSSPLIMRNAMDAPIPGRDRKGERATRAMLVE
jgi:hypothetical protein